ncbi:hypothetical protein Tco_1402056 [Tanacetum coccineum]
MWSQVPSVYDKHALWGISHWGRKCQQFYGFAVNRESARDVYSKHRILAVTKLKIVEWHNYKHLDWITVRRNDDKLYTFKEGDYNKLRLQDIEDMLLLLVQGKLTNLNVEERLALGVSLSNLKRKTPYTAYSNPKGFIYQKKDKKNRLMRIDELHKFSDGTLNDVRSALDDILKRIRMEYLPQTKVIEEPGKIHWWETVRGRPSAAGKDHMIYHMIFDTSAGNPIKEILLKLNLPDHMSILTDSKMEVKVFKITFSHSSQDKGTSSSLKLMITASNHKLMIEVKDYELKTKDKAYYARLADKQSGRPSGSLPSNTQPNLRGGNSKAYQPPQARNKHVNVVFTGSGKSYNPPDKPDESNDINSEKPYQLLDCEMKTMN